MSQIQPKSLREFFLFFIATTSGPPDDDPDSTPDGWIVFDDRTVTAALPPSQYGHVTCRGRGFSVLLVIRSFLRYSPRPNAVAFDLWESISANTSARQHFNTFLVFGPPNTLGLNGSPTINSMLRPTQNRNWNDVATGFIRSSHLGRACQDWVKRWVENLLMGFRSTGGTPATPSYYASNVTSRGGRQQNFRETILQRDGYITVVGRYLARDCPRDREPDQSTFVEMMHVEACHIVPHSSSRNERLLNIIRIFGGTRPDELLTVNGTNHPSNGLMLNIEHRKLYSEDFYFGIDARQTATGTQYYLRRIGSCIDLSAMLRSTPEGTQLYFGANDNSIASPKAYYCNLQLAIAKILRASKAGETISKIYRDEEKPRGEGCTGATWGETGQAYLTNRLELLSGEN